MLLNMEPLLQKMKSSLIKWENIKLILWGTNSMISMVVAPTIQSMMLVYQYSSLGNLIV